MKTYKTDLPDEWNYPCFGKGKMSGIIVMFTQHKVGHCITQTKNFKKGTCSKLWDMNKFTPEPNPWCKEEETKFQPITIVLENDLDINNLISALKIARNLSPSNTNLLKSLISF